MSSKSEFALVTPSKESEARPLVVLLAWLGARRRHVRAYSRLLERNDVQSLTVIGDPNDTIMGRLDNIHDLAKRVIAHLKVSRKRAHIAVCATVFASVELLVPGASSRPPRTAPLSPEGEIRTLKGLDASRQAARGGERELRDAFEGRPADSPTPPVTWQWLNLDQSRFPGRLFPPQKEFPGRRIVLAPFSNGGCYVYEFMRIEMAGELALSWRARRRRVFPRIVSGSLNQFALPPLPRNHHSRTPTPPVLPASRRGPHCDQPEWRHL